jgi:hypothetical protein
MHYWPSPPQSPTYPCLLTRESEELDLEVEAEQLGQQQRVREPVDVDRLVRPLHHLHTPRLWSILANGAHEVIWCYVQKLQHQERQAKTLP